MDSSSSPSSSYFPSSLQTLERTASSDSISSSKTSSSHRLTSAAPTLASRKGRAVDIDPSIAHAERATISSSSSFSSSALPRPSLLSSISRAASKGFDTPIASPSFPLPSSNSSSGNNNSSNNATSYYASLRKPDFVEPSLQGVDAPVAEPSSLPARPSIDRHRLSISSSLHSIGSALMGHGRSPVGSVESSRAGSDQGAERPPDYGPEGAGSSTTTTALSSVSVTALGQSGMPGSASSHNVHSPNFAGSSDNMLLSSHPSSTSLHHASSLTNREASVPRHTRGRTSISRRLSGLKKDGESPAGDRSAASSSHGKDAEPKKGHLGIIGICALDSKARSRPSRNILNRINAQQEFEVVIFGDKVILDEEPENWPVCDYFISFFSEGFPLDKAIAYVKLRRPFSVNDLPMQMVLWDRRVCLQILDKFDVPTPRRIEVSRDGGPRLPSSDVVQHVVERTGIRLPSANDGSADLVPPPKEVYMVDEDTLYVDGQTLKKPFVEKPVSGEDHNIHIYFSKDVGGGGRRLFRKINNKSSEPDDTLSVPRSITEDGSSYIYESFVSTQNHEDVKAYTVGPEFCHAETRKSPVVDGIVKRNTHGKEVRYVTSLSTEEVRIASRISEAFGQRVCGFDLLRVGNKSYVIDVNGWSFVKDNNEYYDRCARILKDLFIAEKQKRESRGDSKTVEAKLEAEEQYSKPSAGRRVGRVLNHIIKSPSMTLLAGNLHSGRSSSKASPDLGHPETVPLTAPPSMERGMDQHPTLGAVAHPDLLPPQTLSSSSNLHLGSLPPPAEPAPVVPPPAAKSQWRLKGMVAVIRHADRTPKQKLKFTFHTKPFIDLLKGHREEVLLVGEAALNSVVMAVDEARYAGVEDAEKLKTLKITLVKKGAWMGTKVQIKPMFRKEKKEETGQGENTSPSVHGIDNGNSLTVEGRAEQVENIKRQNSLNGVTLSRAAAAEDNLELDKLQLIVKWGGEPTHSARYQSQELGENMRNDLILMNRDVLNDVKVFSSSERRVTTSAAIYTTAFLNEKELAPDFVQIRKDLLDDSNAAKDEMDKVKKKLKGLLREGNKADPQFAWPANMPEPYLVAHKVVELMKFHRRVMRDNYAKLYGHAASSLAAAVKSGGATGANAVAGALSQAQNISSIQPRWCCGEDPELFRERWEKLFTDICDQEKIDPGKISELHDTIKFDALHDRQFLEWVFTPSEATLEEFFPASESSSKPSPNETGDEGFKKPVRSDTAGSKTQSSSKTSEKQNLAQRIGLRRRSEVVDPATLRTSASDPATQSYFSLFGGDVRSRAKADQRIEKLRELFLYSKILFDFIGPQEYGITNAEKLEIGLLTSLPLLKAIVKDLEEMQASDAAKTRLYFTKESHIYTLLNCIIEGGIQTKIQRNKIPELDYLSTICFELYESQDPTTDDKADSFSYSIRITISPGCHTFEPLDVQLDSRHTIGFAQRRSLTAHNDWKEVIETLRAKFHTVKLPKSFIAINLSEKVPQAFERRESITESELKTLEGQWDPDEGMGMGRDALDKV